MKHIELAKKLKALSEKGVGGEKVNAGKMLSSLLKKHNLTIEDIEGEKKDNYFFNLKKEEDRLWSQVVKSVNKDIKCYGPFPAKDIKRVGLGGNYMIESTASEYVEIEAKNTIYQKLYKDEVNIFYHAFCTANNILVKTDKAIDLEDLTQEEIETLLRVRKLAKNINTEQYYKQLNQNNI